MLITNIQHYLQQHRQANLAQLRIHFKLDPHVLKNILGLLVRKGRVKKCLKTPQCATQCQKCDIMVTEIYQWIQPGYES
ncbi:MAG: FeoC-like transcriptional regulator [Gammaproteobacteria bacterium]